MTLSSPTPVGLPPPASGHLDPSALRRRSLSNVLREGHCPPNSTQCRDVTDASFSTLPGVLRYVESGGVSRCRDVARAVAARARSMTERARPAS